MTTHTSPGPEATHPALAHGGPFPLDWITRVPTARQAPGRGPPPQNPRGRDNLRAVQVGLINKVAAADELEAVARTWATTVASSAPLVVRAMKTLSQGVVGTEPVAAHVRVRHLLDEILTSRDRVEGIEAVRVGREPTFEGR